MSNLPKGWEKQKLSDIINLIHGYQFRTNDFTENGIAIIKIGNVNGTTLDLSGLSYISKDRFEEFKQYELNEGDILMSLTGNIGRVVEVSNLPFKVLQNYRVGKFEAVDSNIIFKKYIKFLLSSNIVLDRLEKLSNQSAQANFGKQDMDKIFVPLPPLEEQKKIADILSTVDKKIAFVEENINATEELKKSLMQKLLTEGIGHTEFKDSELGRIPESWEVKKLGDIGSLEGGYAFKSGEYNIEEKGYQVIRMSNINTFGLNLVKDPKYLESIEEKAKKYILSMGDILITLTGTIGKTDYGNVAFIDIDKPMVLNQRVGRFVPKKNNYNKFFFYVFNFSLFRNKFFEFGQGGTGNQANVGKNDFESIEIIVPPLEEQKQIAEILSTVDNKLENLKEKKQYFEELKKGLMQKLLTGEVRV